MIAEVSRALTAYEKLDTQGKSLFRAELGLVRPQQAKPRRKYTRKAKADPGPVPPEPEPSPLPVPKRRGPKRQAGFNTMFPKEGNLIPVLNGRPLGDGAGDGA